MLTVGRSIELAIAGYLLDNGKFPTDVSQLTIEYSGNQVVCETTQLNSDSSVYLTGCTVGGRTVDYAYGSDKTPPAPTYTAYTVGNQVSYNNVNYYVIENSDTTQATVKLLKAEPLSAQEISDYKPSDAQTYSSNGYTGLITFEELTENLGFEYQQVNPSAQGYKYTEETPVWAYNSNYYYWTMSPYQEWTSRVWYVGNNGGLESSDVDYSGNYVVRPVIVLSKSLISA